MSSLWSAVLDFAFSLSINGSFSWFYRFCLVCPVSQCSKSPLASHITSLLSTVSITPPPWKNDDFAFHSGQLLLPLARHGQSTLFQVAIPYPGEHPTSLKTWSDDLSMFARLATLISSKLLVDAQHTQFKLWSASARKLVVVSSKLALRILFSHQPKCTEKSAYLDHWPRSVGRLRVWNT